LLKEVAYAGGGTHSVAAARSRPPRLTLEALAVITHTGVQLVGLHNPALKQQQQQQGQL
jgi:hypothetical protein